VVYEYRRIYGNDIAILPVTITADVFDGRASPTEMSRESSSILGNSCFSHKIF